MSGDFEAVVVGGGPAGAVCALALARAGRRVAVVEKAAFPRRKVCGEFLSGTNWAMLESLGLRGAVGAAAGPEVRRVALHAGNTVAEAPMPRSGGWGRALGRDRLDPVLLDAAGTAGAAVFQPFRASALERVRDGWTVRIEAGGEERVLRAPVVVAAHGSWEPGRLPTQLPKSHRPGDLLGFKVHFRGGKLAPDLMPLLLFPGGYGGMVWSDDGRLSLSLCIRRDRLEALRHNGGSAAEAVERHLRHSCRGIREALEGAEAEGPWLAAGPIRPGIRAAYADDIFRVGNVAGESHPIIAEGISMAMQGGWLLARSLLRQGAWTDEAARIAAGRSYEAAWRGQFAARIRNAALLAGLVDLPGAARLVSIAVRACPPLLTLGARLGGKAKRLRNLPGDLPVSA